MGEKRGGWLLEADASFGALLRSFGSVAKLEAANATGPLVLLEASFVCSSSSSSALHEELAATAANLKATACGLQSVVEVLDRFVLFATAEEVGALVLGFASLESFECCAVGFGNTSHSLGQAFAAFAAVTVEACDAGESLCSSLTSSVLLAAAEEVGALVLGFASLECSGRSSQSCLGCGKSLGDGRTFGVGGSLSGEGKAHSDGQGTEAQKNSFHDLLLKRVVGVGVTVGDYHRLANQSAHPSDE